MYRYWLSIPGTGTGGLVSKSVNKVNTVRIGIGTSTNRDRSPYIITQIDHPIGSSVILGKQTRLGFLHHPAH